MTRLPTRAALLAVLLLSLFATPALAHAELLSASPGPDDTVEGSPSELVAEFSQDLDESRTSIEVRDDAGDRVARGGELGDGLREWRLVLPPLAPGSYEVRYTTFSAEDSELHRGRYSFTVVAAASPPPSPSPAPSPLPPPSASASAVPASPPTATASSSPTPGTPTPTPAPTTTPSGGTPGNGTGGTTDMSIVLPILAVLAVVAGLGLLLMRRRTS